jgi:hypothetical protein
MPEIDSDQRTDVAQDFLAPTFNSGNRRLWDLGARDFCFAK